MPTKQKGFTLVEIMVALVIIGAVLAFLLPRAYRASVESKYQLLRQTCTELASWANEWAEKELEIQPTTATSNLSNYMDTLGNNNGTVDWVADAGSGSNWQDDGNPAGNLENIANRNDGTNPISQPNTGVKEIMPRAKILTNPFNGLSVFSSGNDPADLAVNHAVTGAIGCAWIVPPAVTYHYYALVFQGTESTWTNLTTYTFYAGQDEGTIEGLRNGIFVARLEP